MKEYVKLYDKNKKPIDGLYDRYGLFPNDTYYFCINVWLIIDKKIWIQKRSSLKKIYPNEYECVAGGVVGDESIYSACIREILEETGMNINLDKIKLIHEKLEPEYKYYMHTFIAFIDEKNLKNICIDQNEVSEYKILEFSDVEKMVEKKLFTKSISGRFHLYKDILKKYCK